MRLRDLFRLRRLRLAWCEVIRWLAWRVAMRHHAQTGSPHSRMLAAWLAGDGTDVDGARTICTLVSGDLVRGLACRKLQWPNETR